VRSQPFDARPDDLAHQPVGEGGETLVALFDSVHVLGQLIVAIRTFFFVGGQLLSDLLVEFFDICHG
jgi:hypothetical protein